MSIDLVTNHIQYTRSAPTNKSQHRGCKVFLWRCISSSFLKPQWQPLRETRASVGLSTPCSGIWECCCFMLCSGCRLLLSALRGLFRQQQLVSDISLLSSIHGMMTRCFWHNSILSSPLTEPVSGLERKCALSACQAQAGPARATKAIQWYTVYSSVVTHNSPLWWHPPLTPHCLLCPLRCHVLSPRVTCYTNVWLRSSPGHVCTVWVSSRDWSLLSGLGSTSNTRQPLARAGPLPTCWLGRERGLYTSDNESQLRSQYTLCPCYTL